jgi:hypothetical protein
MLKDLEFTPYVQPVFKHAARILVFVGGGEEVTC